MRAPGLYPLLGVYSLYFATTGIILPFLPAFLESLGLSATRVGALLALTPAAALIAPPLWGRLADRSGHPARVLAVIGLGSAVTFALLLVVDHFLAIVVVMLAYGVFASSVTTVLDSVALHRVATHGGAYAHLRLFGSLGFVLSSTAFGIFVVAVGRATIVVPALLMASYGILALALPRGHVSSPSRAPLRMASAAPVKELGVFLVATCLHWIACAPFHGTYALFVGALGLAPWVVGGSAGIGVLAEVGVMWVYPRFAERFAPRHVLAFAFGASAARWIGYGLVDSAGALLALSILHGLTFGAFYVAAVGYMVRRVPPERRARGQAAFVSVTFGIGGLVGYLCAGAGYDLLGGSKLFFVSAGIEVIAMLLVLAVGAPRTLAGAAAQQGEIARS